MPFLAVFALFLVKNDAFLQEKRDLNQKSMILRILEKQ